MFSPVDIIKGLALNSAQDKSIIALRHNMAELTATAFIDTAIEIESLYPFEIGLKVVQIDKATLVEETKAICLILKIAGDLSLSANLLFKKNRAYSASALIRQLVEVEYLAWAFENDSNEAQKWIRSSKEERKKYFTPAKLRDASNGKFCSKDYGYHCELGGHPVPGAEILLNNENDIAQILLSDMLGHTWRIWDHFVKWAMSKYDNHPIMRKSLSLINEYDRWHEKDLLSHLPPPP